LWFLGFWLLLPWPLVLLSDALVPAVRYLLLGCVAASVALTEGAGGPVSMVVAFFIGYGLLTTLLCWIMAWAVARSLVRWLPHHARTITWVCLVVGLLVALLFEPYRTSFGRAATGGLLQVLS